jgi:hypothetical protein
MEALKDSGIAITLLMQPGKQSRANIREWFAWNTISRYLLDAQEKAQLGSE